MMKPWGAPANNFRVVSPPANCHLVAISTVSSSKQSSVPHKNTAGGSFMLYKSAKNGEIEGSRRCSGVVSGRKASRKALMMSLFINARGRATLRMKGNMDISYMPKLSTSPAKEKFDRTFKRCRVVRTTRWPPADCSLSGNFCPDFVRTYFTTSKFQGSIKFCLRIVDKPLSRIVTVFWSLRKWMLWCSPVSY